MRKIENVIPRKSGGLEWNKTVAGVRFTAYGNTMYEMPERIADAIQAKLGRLGVSADARTAKQLERMHGLIAEARKLQRKPVDKNISLQELARNWFELYKRDDVEVSTQRKYEGFIRNQMATLTRSIDTYTKDDMHF